MPKRHFPTLSQEEFNNFQLNLTICPTVQNFTLAGFWSEPYLTYIGLTCRYV